MTRQEIEAEIERLIAVLDDVDVIDEDREQEEPEDEGTDEPGEDEEPSLGWSATTLQVGRHWYGEVGASGIDAEADDDGREPALGWTERFAQGGWDWRAYGRGDDREGGDDPHEIETDDEHDLGWSLTLRQEGKNWWGDVFWASYEFDPADPHEGIGLDDDEREFAVDDEGENCPADNLGIADRDAIESEDFVCAFHGCPGGSFDGSGIAIAQRMLAGQKHPKPTPPKIRPWSGVRKSIRTPFRR